MKPPRSYVRSRSALLFLAVLTTACSGDGARQARPGSPAVADADGAAGRRIVAARIVGDPVYYRRPGDLWMTTWADDGRLYVTWGDGTARGDCVKVYHAPSEDECVPVPTTYSLPELWDITESERLRKNYCGCEFTDAGLLAFSGAPMKPSTGADCIVSLHVPTGIPPFGETGDDCPLDRDDKPSSLLLVGGALYWAGHSPLADPDFGYLAYSTDYGRTWTEVPGSPWLRPSPFRVIMFIQMGMAYALNEDGYVYALAMGTETDWSAQHGNEDRTVYLARVPRSDIARYDAWEYLVDATSTPVRWSSVPSDARPLDGISSQMQGTAMYHEGAGEYLFFTASMKEDGAGRESGLFAAPKPWGPWRRISADLLGDAPASWLPGGYIPGLIAKGATDDSFCFTISGLDGWNHYQLTMGRIKLTYGPKRP